MNSCIFALIIITYLSTEEARWGLWSVLWSVLSEKPFYLNWQCMPGVSIGTVRFSSLGFLSSPRSDMSVYNSDKTTGRQLTDDQPRNETERKHVTTEKRLQRLDKAKFQQVIESLFSWKVQIHHHSMFPTISRSVFFPQHNITIKSW